MTTTTTAKQYIEQDFEFKHKLKCADLHPFTFPAREEIISASWRCSSEFQILPAGWPLPISSGFKFATLLLLGSLGPAARRTDRPKLAAGASRPTQITAALARQGRHWPALNCHSAGS